MTIDEARALPLGTRVIYTPPVKGWPPLEGTIVAVGRLSVQVDFGQVTRVLRPGLLEAAR